MRVEFIGGPLDGDIAELPDGMRYYRVPMASPPCSWMFGDDADYLTAALDFLRFGEYSPNGNPREFLWRGQS